MNNNDELSIESDQVALQDTSGLTEISEAIKEIERLKNGGLKKEGIQEDQEDEDKEEEPIEESEDQESEESEDQELKKHLLNPPLRNLIKYGK